MNIVVIEYFKSDFLARMMAAITAGFDFWNEGSFGPWNYK